MADTQLYRGSDTVAVPDELVEAMVARGWSATEKDAGEDPKPVAPDSTPEGAPTTKKGK